MITILIIILVVMMLGGVGYRSWGPNPQPFGLIEILVILLVIGLVFSLFAPLGRY